MPADGPARVAIARNGGIILTASLDEAIALSQRLAPEHLVCDTPQMAATLTRAGTVFVGEYSAQASGDYVTGSNDVLPTERRRVRAGRTERGRLRAGRDTPDRQPHRHQPHWTGGGDAGPR